MALKREGGRMILVTSISSSQEWIRLRDAAQQAFPNEVLARGENYAPVLSVSGAGVEGGSGGGEEEGAAGASEYDVCSGSGGRPGRFPVVATRQPVTVRLT